MEHSKINIRLRAILLGLLFIPFNNYFLMLLQAKWYAWPTYAVPFSNAVFLLLVLVGLNALLRRIVPSFTLNQPELLTIYVMVSLATGICCYNLMGKLIPLMGHAFWFATPENEWKSLIWQHLPRWLMVDDKAVLRDYYLGESSLYRLEILRAWAVPALWWTLFAFALFYVMMCINVIIRKQWTDRERLTYPITYLPLEMTNTKSRFFSNKLMWIGLSISVAIGIWNGMSFLYPKIPVIPVKRQTTYRLFTEKPWNAIGALTISFYPFIVGLGFLMPIDLSFSCWFFYLMGKVQRIMGSVTNLNSLPGFPFIGEQSLGAYIALCIVPIWTGRRHLKRAIASVFKTQDNYDEGEGMRYRSAIMGIIIGLLILGVFAFNMGMSLWIIPIFFGMYYMIAFIVTRIRAELGFPIHALSNVSGYLMFPNLLGTRLLGTGTLTSNVMIFPFTMGFASNPMPHQLEGLRYAEISGARQKRMMWGMLAAVALGIITTFWVLLHLSYKYGADKGFLSWTTYRYGTSYSLNRLHRWLSFPTQPNGTRIGFVGIGFGVAILFMVMRARFLWWPFHPIGYGLASGWGLSNVWAGIMLSFFIKWLIIKYGGLHSYRRAVPFFLGLVLGDFLIGFSWFIIGTVLNIPTYTFWP